MIDLRVIKTLHRIAWISLKRDYVALGLIFILPIIFFSIFAFIFGGMSSGSAVTTSAMKIIAVDKDHSQISARFLNALEGQEGIELIYQDEPSAEQPNPKLFDAEQARLLVRTGKASAAVIILQGFADRFGTFSGEGARIELVYDSSNPVAKSMISGLLKASSFTTAPDILMNRGISQLEQFGGALTPEQLQAVDYFTQFLNGSQPDTQSGSAEAANAPPTFQGLISVHATAARASDDDGENKQPNMIAYYAAGIGVMFLLFSMAGSSESLLREVEQGTLERVLTSNVSMSILLMSNWVFFALIGMAQLTVMFLWATCMFGLDLFTTNHLIGFAAMTILTTSAAAAFGIVLATLARSRTQLGGMSTIIILIMSALGGSMIPKFAAPAIFDITSKFTFNGWALDRYLNVFWNEDPSQTVFGMLVSLIPQLAVLTLMTILFLTIARLLARRWETV